MPTLKYKDPASSAWIPLALKGAAGATGPQGPAGPDEVFIGTATPALPNVYDLWVDTDETPPSALLGIAGRAIWAPTTDPLTAFTTVIDVPTLSVTWTSDPSRLYRTTVVGNTDQITAIGNQQLLITDGANIVKHTAFGTGQINGFLAWSASVLESGLAAGPQTRKARVTSSIASGRLKASATYPWYITVEDIGAA